MKNTTARRRAPYVRVPEWLLMLVAVVALQTGLARPVPAQLAADLCLTPLVANESLCNPSLALSPWATSHRVSYAQASAAAPGPVADVDVVAEHLIVPGPPIALGFTSEYPDGGRAVWGSPLGLDGAVIKLDHESFSIIDTYIPAEREMNPPPVSLGITGAYNAVDRDDHFIVGRDRSIEVFADSVAGDRTSPIALVKREFLPAGTLCRTDDVIAGMTLTYDDYLAFATEQGVLGVIPRDPALMTPAHLVTVSVNGADCANMAIPTEDLEIVSNSVAADEHGGLYLLTSEAMYKYQWDGTSLTQVWRTEYDSDEDVSAIRLGPGSGSTPSLMGTALDDDKFVVITDGRELMHLLLLWRDDIPPGWQPIAPGKDPRIACEVPVRFGDPAATSSLSEQSVLVRGYSSILVNDQLTDESAFDGVPDLLINIIAALEGGDPAQAPVGLERIDWDPETQTCHTVWTNRVSSIPNAIPTMSASSGLIYAVGQRDGVWGVEAIDFDTGETRFFLRSASEICGPETREPTPALVLPFIEPILDRLPRSCENSFYAGTEIGPDGTIYTGTANGVSKYTPATVPAVPLRRQSIAGTGQAHDLAARALLALPGDEERGRHDIQRGIVQLDATRAALGEAGAAGKIAPTPGSAGDASLDAARAHFVAAEAAVSADNVLAESELHAALADLATALDHIRVCAEVPRGECRAPRRSDLKLKDDVNDARDTFIWKWTQNGGTSAAEFGDPVNVTDYALCLYAGASPSRLVESTVPSSDTLWRTAPTAGEYRDRGATAGGIRKIRLKANGSSARSTILVKGKGIRLADFPLPLDVPVTVQLQNTQTGTCWEAVYEADDVDRADVARFKATARE